MDKIEEGKLENGGLFFFYNIIDGEKVAARKKNYLSSILLWKRQTRPRSDVGFHALLNKANQ